MEAAGGGGRGEGEGGDHRITTDEKGVSVLTVSVGGREVTVMSSGNRT